MRALDPVVVAEKNKAENKPIFLYTLYDYDGLGNNLCYSGYDANVTFGGVEYQRFPIAHEAVSENANGQIDSVKIKVANVSRLMQTYLEQFDLRGKKIDITTVFADQLSNTAYKSVDSFYIDSYTADQNVVEFTLSSKFDIMDVHIPQRKYIRSYCQWKFKSTECGYAGSEAACNKTLGRCGELGNKLRFGGFPSIPQQRTYVQ